MKPSPSDICWSRDCVEWSHDQLTTSLSFGPKLAKSGQKWPKRSLNDQNWPESLKNDIRNISIIGFLLLLRSFWVVTWLVCDSFEFGAKISQNGQNWPKKAPNDRKWPECLWNDWNWLNWCWHSSYRPILSACASFIQQWGLTSQKSQFCRGEKFFMA